MLNFSSASTADEGSVLLSLYGTRDAAIAPALICEQAISSDDNFVPMHYAEIYFQDKLVLVEQSDVDVQISGRTFERELNPTRSSQRIKGA